MKTRKDFFFRRFTKFFRRFTGSGTAFDFLLYEESIACCLQGRQACGVFLLQSGLAVFAVWGYFCTFAGLKKRYKKLKILDFEDTEILSRVAVRPFVTVGMFDGVHAGHRCLLEDLCRRAEAAGAETVVVSFLSHPRAVLGAVEGGFGLLQTNERRFERIASCGVDWLLPLAFTRELAMLKASAFMDMLIERVNPQEVLLGYDNRFGRKGDESFDEIIACGEYRGVRVERSEGRVFCEGAEVSSTRIRKALQEGRVDLAAEMLEEPYSIAGKVEEGRKIGRRIGFPTANIRLEGDKLVPKEGVYAVRVRTGGAMYGGVLNLGGKPTVDTAAWSCEVNVFDFSGDLYGREVGILFEAYLREQKRFASLEALREQIARDCDEAKRILCKG